MNDQIKIIKNTLKEIELSSNHQKSNTILITRKHNKQKIKSEIEKKLNLKDENLNFGKLVNYILDKI